MANRVRGILEHLLGRRLQAAVSEVVGDAELLQRFIATRDEAAFELLVWRHGAMVLGLCRRAIRDEQLAEDAFQAVFLVLARKASSIRRGNVGGWLFRVARRVAARAARKRSVPLPVPDVAATHPDRAEARELGEILDAEVARLPDRLRRVVILCYLGGHTTEDAARELGCPRGTVLSRLATARKRLAERLTRRGVTLPALGVIVGERTTGRLVSQTVALAQNPIRIPAASGPAILAESVVRAMATTKLATICAGVVLATGLSLGVGWVAAETDDQPTNTTAALEGIQPPQKKEAAKQEDRAAILRRQSDEIARGVEQLQARINAETMEPDGGVDVALLKAELFELEKKILTEESEVKSAARVLEDGRKEKGELAKQPLDDRYVQAKIQEAPSVKAAKNRTNQARAVRESIKSTAPANGPVFVSAEKELAAANAELTAAADAARPLAEKSYREYAERNLDRAIESWRASMKESDLALAASRDKRKQLLRRIGASLEREAHRQILQDELNVLRGIQMEVLRIRTLTELGIEPAPPARQELDPRIEAQLKSLKQEIEALRAEVKALRKK